jgi:hypothetical protein
MEATTVVAEINRCRDLDPWLVTRRITVCGRRVCFGDVTQWGLRPMTHYMWSDHRDDDEGCCRQLLRPKERDYFRLCREMHPTYTRYMFERLITYLQEGDRPCGKMMGSDVNEFSWWRYEDSGKSFGMTVGRLSNGNIRLTSVEIRREPSLQLVAAWM